MLVPPNVLSELCRLKNTSGDLQSDLCLLNA